jgi:hypothetical protein
MKTSGRLLRMLGCCFAFVVLAGVGHSCGDWSEGQAQAGSCKMPAGCIDYTGIDWASDKTQERCAAMMGTYSSSDCPTEDLVGSCISAEGETDEYIFHFYAPAFDAASAESTCRSGGDGTWVPAP